MFLLHPYKSGQNCNISPSWMSLKSPGSHGTLPKTLPEMGEIGRVFGRYNLTPPSPRHVEAGVVASDDLGFDLCGGEILNPQKLGKKKQHIQAQQVFAWKTTWMSCWVC